MTEGCSTGISVRSVLRPSFVPAFVKETGNPSVPSVPKGTEQMCVEEKEEDQTCKKSLGGSLCSSSPSTGKVRLGPEAWSTPGRASGLSGDGWPSHRPAGSRRHSFPAALPAQKRPVRCLRSAWFSRTPRVAPWTCLPPSPGSP